MTYPLVESIELANVGGAFNGISPPEMYEELFYENRPFTDFNHLIVFEILRGNGYSVHAIDRALFEAARVQVHRSNVPAFLDKNMFTLETVQSFAQLQISFTFFCDLLEDHPEPDHEYAVSQEFLKRLFFFPDMIRVKDIHEFVKSKGFANAKEAHDKRYLVVMMAPRGVDNFFIPFNKTRLEMQGEKALLAKPNLVPSIAIHNFSYYARGYKCVDPTICWYDDMSI